MWWPSRKVELGLVAGPGKAVSQTALRVDSSVNLGCHGRVALGIKPNGNEALPPEVVGMRHAVATQRRIPFGARRLMPACPPP
jgi:hypothetical protein